ncbi:MAG: cytochrome c [Chloroflexi bacterium]|nr:cytochrome c [Chloroflexota bacterium]
MRYLYQNVVARDTTPAASLINPFVPDSDSIARGAALYQTNCISCHGSTGKGDGLQATQLNPRPADFTAGHTDAHLMGMCSTGFRTASPARPCRPSKPP